MGGYEDWRRRGETQKMNPEEAKRAGGVLHQRRKMPYSPATMAAIGVVIVGTVAYFALYTTKKPQASATDVAKVTTGIGTPQDSRPTK